MTRAFSGEEAGTFFLASIGLSLVTWRISFTLGAYGEVFYTDFLSIWFVSLASLVAIFVVGRTADGTRYLTWWGTLLFSLPTVVMTSAIWSTTPQALSYLALLLLPAIPYTAYILVSVAVPEAAELHSKRLFRWLVVIVIVIVVFVNGVSFLVGKYNFAFMTCVDFSIAGDHLPENCWRG